MKINMDGFVAYHDLLSLLPARHRDQSWFAPSLREVPFCVRQANSDEAIIMMRRHTYSILLLDNLMMIDLKASNY